MEGVELSTMDYLIKNIFRYFSKISRCSLISIFLLLWIVFQAAGAEEYNTDDIIADAAHNLADSLEKHRSLSGVKIQVSENNLWERQTQMNLPFSAVLRDALALKISENKAIVTVRETGDEPLILAGTYGFENDSLVITVRLRKMGDEASEDLAVARESVPRSKVDEKWFKPDFKRVARTLVRLLEKNYYGADYLALEITYLKPGLKGQPSILLGQEFPKYLETAVSSSSLFEMSSLAPERTKAVMKGTYSNVSGRMHFNISITGAENNRLASADFDIPSADIPKALFKEVSIDDLTVCLQYKTSSQDDLASDSSAAEELLSLISESLGEHGIKSVSCPDGTSGKISIKAKINVKKKPMKGDRFIINGKIRLDVFDENGDKIGSLPVKPIKASFISADNAEDISKKIFAKYFSSQNIGDECAKLILKRKKY